MIATLFLAWTSGSLPLAVGVGRVLRDVAPPEHSPVAATPSAGAVSVSAAVPARRRRPLSTV